jgi:hypothetical protein
MSVSNQKGINAQVFHSRSRSPSQSAIGIQLNRGRPSATFTPADKQRLGAPIADGTEFRAISRLSASGTFAEEAITIQPDRENRREMLNAIVG